MIILITTFTLSYSIFFIDFSTPSGQNNEEVFEGPTTGPPAIEEPTELPAVEEPTEPPPSQ